MLTSDPKPVSSASETRWPNILGMIALCVGITGMMAYGCCGIGAMMLEPFAFGTQPEMTAAEQEYQRVLRTVNQRFFFWKLFQAVALGALGLMLAFAGMGLHRQQPSAVLLIRTWAWLKIGFAVPAAIMIYVYGQAQWNAYADAAGRLGEEIAESVEWWTQFWLATVPVTAMIWWISFPIFVLFWFSRRVIRSETEQWKSGRPLEM